MGVRLDVQRATVLFWRILSTYVMKSFSLFKTLLPLALLLAPTAAVAQSTNAARSTNAAPAVAAPSPALKTPAALNATAPATFKAAFETSKGKFVIEVTRAWAPNGADRFYNLVKNGFFTDARFFRVVSSFMVQFGISGDPAISAPWRAAAARITDDPVKQSNKRSYISFATSGPNTRPTQMFINFADNARLDGLGFSPFGQVTSGMDVVDKLYSGYGEGAPSGRGPDQQRIQMEVNSYLTKDFPLLDYIKTATIEP